MIGDGGGDSFGWTHTGKGRPSFAVEPGPGQESVWDYPRPPVARADSRLVLVKSGAVEIARSEAAVRVLETASPPTFYLSPQDVRVDCLEPATGSSFCEWKGAARYWNVVAGGRRFEGVAWSYPDPTPAFESIRDFFSFYPGRLECFVGGERVEPQPGGFYGGWLTSEIVGPVKGDAGTSGW